MQNPTEQRQLGAEPNLSAILWRELAAAVGRAKEDLTAGFQTVAGGTVEFTSNLAGYLCSGELQRSKK